MRDYIEVVILLDRSGSMHAQRADHEGGLRSFVRDQRRLAGDVRLTFVRFDDRDPFEVVYDGAKLEDVDEARLELIPRGRTPLLDAVGRTLEHVHGRLFGVWRKPDQVVVMVITDGEENQSRTYTKARVQQLVKAREMAGWKILYLGANVDEFAEAGGMGIGAATTLGYSPSAMGIQATYSALSSNMLKARSLTQTGATLAAVNAAYDFTPEQRTMAKAGSVAPETTTGGTGGRETATSTTNTTNASQP